MFAQDYDDDDELSGDDRGRSPRGAGGFASRAADAVERRIAEGREPMEFGRSRRGKQGQAFGVTTAPLEALELDGLDGLDGAKPRGARERVSELRDYSSRQWRGGRDVGSEGPVAAVVPGPAVHSGAAAAAAEERELALLTGRKRPTPGTTAVLSGIGMKDKMEEKQGKKDKDKKEKSKKDKKNKKDKEKKKHKKSKKAKKKKSSSSS
eukprot:symbB.v1.2.012304.t1/scaffold844.1/size158302/7